MSARGIQLYAMGVAALAMVTGVVLILGLRDVAPTAPSPTSGVEFTEDGVREACADATGVADAGARVTFSGASYKWEARDGDVVCFVDADGELSVW